MSKNQIQIIEPKTISNWKRQLWIEKTLDEIELDRLFDELNIESNPLKLKDLRLSPTFTKA